MTKHRPNIDQTSNNSAHPTIAQPCSRLLYLFQLKTKYPTVRIAGTHCVEELKAACCCNRYPRKTKTLDGSAGWRAAKAAKSKRLHKQFGYLFDIRGLYDCGGFFLHGHAEKWQSGCACLRPLSVGVWAVALVLLNSSLSIHIFIYLNNFSFHTDNFFFSFSELQTVKRLGNRRIYARENRNDARCAGSVSEWTIIMWICGIFQESILFYALYAVYISIQRQFIYCYIRYMSFNNEIPYYAWILNIEYVYCIL